MVSKNKTAIVCFTGIDGSGKTSHARLLQIRMEKIGFPCKYAWCRWPLGLSSPFHFVVRKTLGYEKEEYRFCKPLLSIFRWLIFLDFVINIIFKIRIPLFRGYYVIVDRYVYDVIADLKRWGFDGRFNGLFVQLLIKMNPVPYITFLIDVPPNLAFSRKKEISVNDLVTYDKIFRSLATQFGFRRISNINFTEAHNQILRETLSFIVDCTL